MTILPLPDSESPPDEAASGPEPVTFPLSWLLEAAPPPIQYRAIADVARLDVSREEARLLALSHVPAIRLALAQGGDGTWGDAILTVPGDGGKATAVGTVPAFRRLLEFGWDRESPPLVRARRILFRLLAEDDDADLLFELGDGTRGDPDLIHRARSILREAAAAALAHAGYEADPRLRGAARRILGRVDAYLDSPLREKPWIRVGNRQVLAAEAYPPSVHVLTMLAHMPLFRSENHAPANRLLQHVLQPLPRQEAFQLVGKQVVAQPHLVLGDPLANRNAADADVPFALTWLELMARLQFLRRHDAWLQLFERFLDDRDRNFVWHPHRVGGKTKSSNPEVWPLFPLDERGTDDDRRCDVTFRLGLIARLLGRPVELI